MAVHRPSVYFILFFSSFLPSPEISLPVPFLTSTLYKPLNHITVVIMSILVILRGYWFIDLLTITQKNQIRRDRRLNNQDDVTMRILGPLLLGHMGGNRILYFVRINKLIKLKKTKTTQKKFLSLRVFRLLASSSLLYLQHFGQCILWPSSGISYWTKEPTQNFELNPWFNPRG